jgi:hypothetical protein
VAFGIRSHRAKPTSQGVFEEGPAGDVLTESRLSALYGVPIRGATALVDGVAIQTLFADLRPRPQVPGVSTASVLDCVGAI